jgi:site-specific recombinase XerD
LTYKKYKGLLMILFDIEKIANKILDLLVQSKKSVSRIKCFKNIVFGTIIPYFEGQNTLEVTDDLLDQFVIEMHNKLNHNEISRLKFQLARQYSELMKYYTKTGSVDMPRVRLWVPNLQKSGQSLEYDTPTEDQLSDPLNIFSLVWHIKQKFIEIGVTDTSIKNYCKGLSFILRYHYEKGEEHYSENLISEALSEIQNCFENGLVSAMSFARARKASLWLSQIHQTGNIELFRLAPFGKRELSPEFFKYLDIFCNNSFSIGYSKGSVVRFTSCIRNFLFELEDIGIQTFKGVSSLQITMTITNVAKRYFAGLSTMIWSVRKFLKYLYKIGVIPTDLSYAIPQQISTISPIKNGFTVDEIKMLLDAPNRNTPIGKRDYAIMLLAVQTGLRACDIANINLHNINWRSKEIHITLQKTNKALLLPITTECRDAIADYVLYGRPKTDLLNVFLCYSVLKRPVTSATLRSMLRKYIINLNLTPAGTNLGFHNFRRSLGKNLLNKGVSSELIQQIFGDSSVNSIIPYIAIDEYGLKNCSLNLPTLEE